MDSDKLTIIDENGSEMEMTILFTFENEDLGKQYVFYYDDQDESGEVFVASYTDEGGLSAVEDEAEWEVINEVFETFNAHQEEHHHDHDHEHGCCCGHNH